MTNLIPESILDETTEIYGELIEKIFSTDVSQVVTTLIDNVDSSILPHLAKRLSIDENEGWELATTDIEKRELIKNAIPIHKKKGYISGLKSVLEKLNINGEIKPWHKYGGKAGHIKIVMNLINKAFNELADSRLKTMVLGTKRQSAIIDNVEVLQVARANLNLVPLSYIEEVVFVPVYMGNTLIWDNSDGTASTSFWADEDDLILSQEITNLGTISPFELSVLDVANFDLQGNDYADFKCALKIKKSDTDISYVIPKDNEDEFPVIRVFAENATVTEPDASENVLLVLQKGIVNQCQIYNPDFNWTAGGTYILEVYSPFDGDGYWGM